MNVIGNAAGFRLEDVVCLVRAAETEGTLTLTRGARRIRLFFQGGMILLPLQPAGGTRAADEREANRRVAELFTWQTVDFDFAYGEVPPGFCVRRSLVISPSKFLIALRRRARDLSSSGRGGRVGMFGTLSSVGLISLMRHLRLGRYSGLLLVGAGEHPLKLCFAEGSPYMKRSRAAAVGLYATTQGPLTLPLEYMQAASFTWTRGRVAGLTRQADRYVRIRTARPRTLTRSAG